MAIRRDQAVKLAQDYTGAWNTGLPQAVADLYATDGKIVINSGNAWTGRAKVAEMAAGFFADVPDLLLACNEVRHAGDHIVYLWTFTGTHAGTKNSLSIAGWEEWDVDSNLKITSSRGWFDTTDYARQIAGE
jgi:uncharacterized protein (TIGR02246 family)